MKKKRYAICGLSVRGIYQFVMPLVGKNRENGPNFDGEADLVGILDIDPNRVEAFTSKMGLSVPYYPADSVSRMIQEAKVDTLLVAGPDVTHCGYIEAGLLAGCDVIVEKPIAIDCAQVRRILEAERTSGRRVLVTHNYRYTPTHKRLKRMILNGDLGRIINVEFSYNLDTHHGSSYFFRWNRMRAMSGGLVIHKSCHHFDLVNWWLADTPTDLCAFGGLSYYGPQGAIRPRDAQGQPLPRDEERDQCPIFQKHHAASVDPVTRQATTGWNELELPYDTQYPPDSPRYIYDEEIDIEDHYSAVVRYRGGAAMSYSCNFCTPWEGYILGINGTKGRVEITHRSDPDPTGKTNPVSDVGHITYYPLFGGKQVIEIPAVAGGHGGADFAIQRDLFAEVSEESRALDLVADSRAGGIAVAMGEACWRSMKGGQLISIDSLLAGDASRPSQE